MGQKQASPQRQAESGGCVIDHPRFRQARLLSDRTGESIQISVPVMSEGELGAWEKGFRALLAHDCLLLPLSFEFHRTQLCGANGICKVKFDNYPFLLREEIANRRSQQGKPFDGQELWYLALSLLEGARVLHGRGEKVGDVQPGNVFINDNGQAKLANQHSYPHELDNYQKTVFEKTVTFLAPEEVRDLHFGLTETKADFATAEAFSVGLTLLDTACLTDSADLYSLAAFRIDYQKLDQRRNSLRSAANVDEALRQIILGLTEVDPKERLLCSKVHEWMEQFREQIVNMESFEIRELPPWTKPSQRSSLQLLKTHTQPPFYVDNRHFQTNLYEEPRLIYEQRPLPLPPQPATVAYRHPLEPPQPPQLPEPYRLVQQQQPIRVEPRFEQRVETRPAVPTAAEVGVYESSYVQVPANAPSISISDDFRTTLQKIDEQLAVSRKMFPIA